MGDRSTSAKAAEYLAHFADELDRLFPLIVRELGGPDHEIAEELALLAFKARYAAKQIRADGGE